MHVQSVPEILNSFGNCSSCWMVTELEQFQPSTKRKLYNCLWWTKGTHSQSFLFLSQLFQHYCFTSVIWGRKFLCTRSSHRSSRALLFWAGVSENLDIKKASGPDGFCDERKAHTLDHFFHSCFKTTVSALSSEEGSSCALDLATGHQKLYCSEQEFLKT